MIVTRLNNCAAAAPPGLPGRLAIAALVGTLAVAAIGCEKKDQAPAETKPVAVPVAVMEVETTDVLADVARLHGKTEPNRVVDVASEVAGRVEDIRVEEGQTVRCEDADCVLVQLNTDLLQAQYDRYKSEAGFNQRDYERLQEAYKRGVATQTEVDQARMRAESFRALMDSAAAELERSTIRPPIDGLVNEIPIEEGEYLQPGSPVVQIVDLDVIKVVVNVPERDISYFSLGDEATVVLNGDGGEREMAGRITFISQLADPATFTSRVEISVPNADRRLRTGKVVDVLLTRRTIPHAVLVPLSTVIPRENDYVVYLVNDNTAHRQVVELGLIRGQDVQVTSGLAAGDRLIISGHRLVADGQLVRIEPTVEEKLEAELAADTGEGLTTQPATQPATAPTDPETQP